MDIGGMDHPSRRILRQYQQWGEPVVLLGKKLTEGQRREDLGRGPQKLVLDHIPFLWEEVSSMIEKGQLVVLPYLVANDLLGLRLIPPGVKEERDRWPRQLGDYSYTNLNS